MPRTKGIMINCEKLLRHSQLDSLMFGYVIGVINILPSVPIAKALQLFMKDFNLSEDDYSFDSAQTRFYHLFSEYKDFRKDHT
jgi:hypothetical protein